MASVLPIPAYDVRGLLPPIDVRNVTDSERSPYCVRLLDFVLRFGISNPRIAILEGYLNYRSKLHALGLSVGFQWVNGSFVEKIEDIENRPPNDIDVVTFYHLPPGVDQRKVFSLGADLFPSDRAGRDALKAAYHVDAFVVSLSKPPELLVESAAYWHSVWSHRRNKQKPWAGEWKGYLQIDLDPTDDSDALSHLSLKQASDGEVSQ